MFRSVFNSVAFRKAFLSYTAIVVIPIILSGILLIQKNIAVEQKKIYNDYSTDARRISRSIDGKLIELKHMGDRMSNKAWVKKLMVNSEIYADEFDIFRNLEIREDFNNTLAEIPEISAGIIVYPEKKLTQSYWGQSDTDYFFTSVVSLDKDVKPQIFDSFHEYNVLKIMAPATINLWDRTKKVIPVIQSLEIVDRPRAVLVLFVDSQNLSSFIQRTSGTKPISVSIVDSAKNNYAHVQNKSDIINGNFIKNIEFKIDSESSRLSYIFSYPDSIAAISIKNILTPLVYICLSLIAGIIIAFIFARISYKPVHELFKKVSASLRSQNVSNGRREIRVSEYNIIENSINNLLDENKTLHQAVKDYESAARCNIFIRLLRGHFEDDLLPQRLAELEINYTNDMYFCILLINYNEFNKFSSINLTRKVEIATMITVENIMRQIDMGYQVFEVTNADMAVILSSDRESVIREEKDRIISDTLNELFQSCKVIPDIVSGSIEKGFIGISKSYYTANENLQYKIFSRDGEQPGQDINYTELYYYPTDWEVQLINNLKIGNLDTFTRILDEIKIENTNRKLSEDCMSKLTSLLMETILRVLNELNIDAGIYTKQFSSRMQAGGNDSSWSYIYEVGGLVCERVRYSNTPTTMQFGNKLLLYINNNYTSVDMSLKKLEEVFEMSISGISKTFKEVTGINFYDYICRLRMEKAKELLRNTSCEVSSVAGMVGYENVYSFKRAFVRYEGIKPDEYIQNIGLMPNGNTLV